MLDDDAFLTDFFAEVDRRVAIERSNEKLKTYKNCMFFITIDSYFPQEGHWDIDEFEAEQLTLAFNRCGKNGFKEAYSLARALASDLKVNAERNDLVSLQEAVDVLKAAVLVRTSEALPLCTIVSAQELR